jgi:hypothetical protein
LNSPYLVSPSLSLSENPSSFSSLAIVDDDGEGEEDLENDYDEDDGLEYSRSVGSKSKVVSSLFDPDLVHALEEGGGNLPNFKLPPRKRVFISDSNIVNIE